MSINKHKKQDEEKTKKITQKYGRDHDCQESSSCELCIIQALIKNKSDMLQNLNLLTVFNMKDQMKVVTDLAFNAVDEDGSGGLD